MIGRTSAIALLTTVCWARSSGAGPVCTNEIDIVGSEARTTPGTTSLIVDTSLYTGVPPDEFWYESPTA